MCSILHFLCKVLFHIRCMLLYSSIFVLIPISNRNGDWLGKNDLDFTRSTSFPEVSRFHQIYKFPESPHPEKLWFLEVGLPINTIYEEERAIHSTLLTWNLKFRFHSDIVNSKNVWWKSYPVFQRLLRFSDMTLMIFSYSSAIFLGISNI